MLQQKWGSDPGAKGFPQGRMPLECNWGSVLLGLENLGDSAEDTLDLPSLEGWGSWSVYPSTPGHCLRLPEGLTPIALAWLPMNVGEQEALGWEQPGVCAKRRGQCTTGRGLPVPLNRADPSHSANPNLAPQACFIPHTPRSRLQFTPRSSQEPTPSGFLGDRILPGFLLSGSWLCLHFSLSAGAVEP